MTTAARRANWKLFHGSVNAAHQVSIHKEHREVHQNPGGQHEDDSIEAQDVEQPQVVDPCVAQNL